MMPGRTLHRLATHICSARTLERVVEPAIADLQKEFEGGSDRVSRRVWVLLTGYVAILKVMFLCAVSVSTTSTDARRAIARTMTWSITLIVAVTALLMLPPLAIVDAHISLVSLGALIPQAVPLAIPIGIAFGIAFGMAGRPATGAIVKAVLLFACAASIVSFVTLAWVMPATNQAFRESVAHARGQSGPLMKGASEMTLSELDREVVIAAAARNPRRANDYAWTFHLRFALSVASVVLAAFVFATGGRGATVRGGLAFAACFLYWALLYTGEALSVPRTALPPSAAAWLPNIILGALATVVASSRSSRLRGWPLVD